MTSIFTKIQKLRRLEKSPYPEEAEAAKRKADALIEKHGLSYENEFFGKDEHFDWTECTKDWQQELYSYIERFNLKDHLEEEGGFILITLSIEFCMKYGRPDNPQYLSGYRDGVEKILMEYYGEREDYSDGQSEDVEVYTEDEEWDEYEEYDTCYEENTDFWRFRGHGIYNEYIEDLNLRGFIMSTSLLTDLLDGVDIDKAYGEQMIEYLDSA